MFNFQRAHAPLGRAITTEDLGGAALYLLSDLSRSVTGEIHYVDGGYNIVAMPRLGALKTQDEKTASEAAE
jgi:enoyl-[acyl-carrier protein] reductase I